MTELEKIPEMMNEGQKNMLEWLLTFPDPEEVKKELPLLQALSCKPEEARGLDVLEPDQQEIIIKELKASSYLVELAFKIMEGGQPQLEEDRKKPYRTAAKAGNVIKNYPQSIATVTLPSYDNAISLCDNGNAYLAPLPSTDGLKFKDGKMFFEGNLAPISAAQLQNMKTKENINSIDLPLLRSFYSILLSENQKSKKKLDVISLYIPDLAAHLGKPRNLNEERIQGIIADVQKFHNIVGLIKTPWGDSIFPVLNFEGYDKEANTISFSSPYMNYLMNKLLELSIRKDGNGKPKLKKNSEPLRLPRHSYAIKSDIVKERNKNAIENVFIIVNTIEKAGSNTPHLAASTIIERNPQFKEALERSTNQTQLLQRCFKKTWELLRSKTFLSDMYKDIELPDPKDPANIPTTKTLNSMVFKFPHNGKKKQDF